MMYIGKLTECLHVLIVSPVPPLASCSVVSSAVGHGLAAITASRIFSALYTSLPARVSPVPPLGSGSVVCSTVGHGLAAITARP